MWHAYVDSHVGSGDENELETRVGGRKWTFQEFEEEIDPKPRVRGRNCLFCLSNLTVTVLDNLGNRLSWWRYPFISVLFCFFFMENK
jgi:hypothetical protein